jgi:hypothetical protein
MVGSCAQQPLIVWIAAHHPVQDHQVGRRHRPRIRGEIMDAPVKEPLDPCLPGEFVRLVPVGRESSRFWAAPRLLSAARFGSRRCPADLQHGGPFDAALAQELDHRLGGPIDSALAVSVGEPVGDPLVEEAATVA